MQIEFETARDGNKTCKINSVFIHSKYSPVTEAQRFADSQQISFKADFVFIIEPCLSYCALPLRNRFPSAKLIAIRFCEEFKESDILFDEVYYATEKEKRISSGEYFFSKYGEESFSYSLFTAWEPAAKVFHDETIEVLHSLKEALAKAHSVLATRNFFEKKWLKNSIRNISLSNKLISFSKKGTCPAVICASGPSLKEVIPFLQKQHDIFIIALSSAVSPLLKNGITPDICFSTDGGFWAKFHLNGIQRNRKLKLVLGLEGETNKSVCRENELLLLDYGDCLLSSFLKENGFPSFHGLRCGTVSGTALAFAEKITSGPVYFAGLDLSTAKGFQHTQPNELEIRNSASDSRVHPAELRLTRSEFSNQKNSLKIYENWFKSYKTVSSVSRIINNAENSLGSIKDITPEDFKDLSFSGTKPEFIIKENLIEEKKLKDFIWNISETEKWMKTCFCLDFLNYTHCNDENKKEELNKTLKEKNKAFLETIWRLFTKN